MGNRIKEIRECKKMTQEELARATGLPKGTILLLESGTAKTIGSKVLLSIANALGVSVDCFIYPESTWADTADQADSAATAP